MHQKRKHLKISAVWFMIALLLAQFGFAAPAAPPTPGPDEVIINGQIVKKASIKPELNIMGNMQIPTYSGGQEVVLNIPVENTSIHQAVNAYVELQLTSGANAPFEIQQLKLREKVPFIYPNSVGYATFRFKVKADAKDGSYALPVKIKYGNMYNYNEFESTDTVYVQVKNTILNPDLIVNDISVGSGEVEAGSSSKLTVNLLNQGQNIASNVRVTLEGFKNEEIMPNSSQGTNATVSTLNNINPGASKEATFGIEVNDKLTSGNYKLNLKINYQDISGREQEQIQEITIPVVENEKNASLTITDLVYPTDNLRRDRAVDIGFKLNNHSEFKLYDVKISLEKDPAIVMKSQPIIKYDSFYGYYAEDIKFSVAPSDMAVGQSYPVTIKVEYKTDKWSDKVFTYEKYISLLVSKKPDTTKLPKTKLIVSNYSYESDYVEAGKPFDLNVTLQNTNASRGVRNVKVSISSQDGIFAPVGSSNTFYFNSMKARGTSDLTLTLKSKIGAEQKSYNVFVDMEYEDYEGKEYTSKETIGVAVVQDTRLNIGELEIPSDGTIGQQVDLNLPFYNFGKTILRNLIVKIEGDFTTDTRETYYGNFSPGNEESFSAMISPMNEGENKGKIVFNFEDAMGKTQNIEKEFSMTAMAMPEIEMPAEGEFPMGPDMGPMEPEGGNKGFVKWIVIGVGAIAIVVVIVVVKKKRKKKREEFLAQEDDEE
jgi:hypothetical protein